VRRKGVVKEMIQYLEGRRARDESVIVFRHTFINLECRWCGEVNCEGGADYFVKLCGRCILFQLYIYIYIFFIIKKSWKCIGA
jgi:hypothetical protein